MAKSELVTVRLERQPNRRALERLRAAYECLQQAGQRVAAEGDSAIVQEVDDEPGSGPVRASIDPPAGARGHD